MVLNGKAKNVQYVSCDGYEDTGIVDGQLVIFSLNEIFVSATLKFSKPYSIQENDDIAVIGRIKKRTLAADAIWSDVNAEMLVYPILPYLLVDLLLLPLVIFLIFLAIGIPNTQSRLFVLVLVVSACCEIYRTYKQRKIFEHFEKSCFKKQNVTLHYA